jgi:hypothetical protein
MFLNRFMFGCLCDDSTPRFMFGEYLIVAACFESEFPAISRCYDNDEVKEDLPVRFATPSPTTVRLMALKALLASSETMCWYGWSSHLPSSDCPYDDGYAKRGREENDPVDE